MWTLRYPRAEGQDERDIERLVLPSMNGSNTDNRQAAGQDQRPVSSVATSEAILLGSNLAWLQLVFTQLQ